MIYPEKILDIYDRIYDVTLYAKRKQCRASSDFLTPSVLLPNS